MFGLQMINEMERMQRDMDRFFNGLGLGYNPDSRLDTSEVKVKSIDGGYQLVAALPGIEVNKLDIDILGRRLTLAFEEAVVDTGAEVIWHRRERQGRSFKRSLTLPEEINAEKVEAEYSKGILTINLPKAESALPKKISVKAV